MIGRYLTPLVRSRSKSLHAQQRPQLVTDGVLSLGLHCVVVDESMVPACASHEKHDVLIMPESMTRRGCSDMSWTRHYLHSCGSRGNGHLATRIDCTQAAQRLMQAHTALPIPTLTWWLSAEKTSYFPFSGTMCLGSCLACGVHGAGCVCIVSARPRHQRFASFRANTMCGSRAVMAPSHCMTLHSNIRLVHWKWRLFAARCDCQVRVPSQRVSWCCLLRAAC